MAIHKIISLNYITAGNNRAFVNMDTVLDYELYRPICILRNEEPYISAAAVSEYSSIDNVIRDWSVLSDDLGSFGGLDAIIANWDRLSNQVTAAILRGKIDHMTETPLSVLCSDIVTEHKDGNWLKTDYLTEEFDSGNAEDHAMAQL